MIPVRHVDDGLVGRLAAGQHADHVARGLLERTAFQVKRCRRAQRYRLEAALAGGGAQLGQILSGGLEQCGCGIAADPALHRHARGGVVLGRQVVLRAGPGVFHHVPAVGGTLGVVDDQRRGGTLARGFLELVGPAAVPGHALAVEQLRVVRMEAGIVDQHHHGLALDVESGVIVPLLFRCVDTVADEHQRAVLDADQGLAGAGADDHVAAELQHLRRACHIDVQHGRFVCGGFHHRHALEPLAAIAWLQADPRELRLDVVDGLVLTRGARPAAGERIGCELLHMRGEIAGIDRVMEGVIAGSRRRRGRSLRGGDGGVLAARRARAQGDQDEWEQGRAHRGTPIGHPAILAMPAHRRHVQAVNPGAAWPSCRDARWRR